MKFQISGCEHRFALATPPIKAIQAACCWMLFLMTLLAAGKSFAADVTAEFNVANKLYAEGQFAAAADNYEKILQTGATSPALWFNYGNAEFKLGKLGSAIAAYRRAELLSPRDAEVRANLKFVRHQVQGDNAPASRWEGWLGQLTLNEWTFLSAAAFWVTFLLFTLKQIRPALAAKLRSATFLFLALTLLSGAALGVQAVEHFSTQTAVVIAVKAEARSGPFKEAQAMFSVQNGAELAVLEHHGDWLKVTDDSGNIGWLPAKQVAVLPGA